MTGAGTACGYTREHICDACHIAGFAPHGRCVSTRLQPCKCRVYPTCAHYRPAYVIGTAVSAALATLATNTGVL